MSVTANLTTNVETITATIVVEDETITAEINTAARGPAGPAGSASNTITSATTSDGTANLSLSNVTTATATITGISVAPTAATTTSTTQLATTAFVQQELASGVAVAKNLEFLAHNGTGATITKGSIVYINGALSGNPRITLAQANNDTNSARTIGFAKADIANGANGFVIMEGELENVRTADADGIIGAGNQIYLSPTTPGAFTRTKPSAPNHLVYVGVVTRASTGANLDGRILVGIQNGYELNEIHDVAISSPAAKQVLKRNAGNTLWVNEAIVSADVSDATSAATANTLVRRDASGDAAFGALTTSGLTVTGGTTFGEESLVQFDAIEYYYGTGAASAHRIALGAGTTGATLFGAATAAAARTTLELGAYATNGSITGTGALTFATSSNSDVNFSPDGVGKVNILGAAITGAGALNVTSDGGDVPIFTTYAGAGSSASGVMIRKARGTAASPTACQSSDLMGGVLARGHNGTSYTTSSNGGIYIYASENWAVGANGTRIGFETTANGGTTRTQKLGISDSGIVSITATTASTSTTTGALVVSGGVGIAGAVTTANFIAGAEMTAPAAPAANGYRIYAEDNGAGKTRLMVLFATGAAQQIAIEP